MHYQITDMIKRYEGLSLKPYRCNAGKLTIGFGRNLEDVGIDVNEAEIMLSADLQKAEEELKNKVPFYKQLSLVRKGVLLNMAFNLGITGLLKFKNMLSAMERRDYDTAADEMLDSKWAKEVGSKADELAQMMKEDAWVS